MKNIQPKNQKKVFHYDLESDVFYIGIKKGFEEKCIEVAPGVNVELDENGRVIGVEILNASKVFKLAKSLKKKTLEEIMVK